MIPEPDYDYIEEESKYQNYRNNNFNSPSASSSAAASSSIPISGVKLIELHRSHSLPPYSTKFKMPQFDDNGLVIPRKPNNPCVESTDRRSLHKEMLWNQKMGKNVLEKNELQMVMEKRKDEQKRKEVEAEKFSRRSSLEKRLEEQQLKIKHQEESANEGSNDKGQSHDQQQSEFLKIYTKVKSATNDVSIVNNNSLTNKMVKSEHMTNETPKSGTSACKISELSERR